MQVTVHRLWRNYLFIFACCNLWSRFVWNMAAIFLCARATARLTNWSMTICLSWFNLCDHRKFKRNCSRRMTGKRYYFWEVYFLFMNIAVVFLWNWFCCSIWIKLMDETKNIINCKSPYKLKQVIPDQSLFFLFVLEIIKWPLGPFWAERKGVSILTRTCRFPRDDFLHQKRYVRL